MGKEAAFCYRSKVSLSAILLLQMHPQTFASSCARTCTYLTPLTLYPCRQLRYAYAKLLLQALAEGSGGGLLRENPPRGPLEPLSSSKKTATAMHHRNTRQADQQVAVAASNSVRMTPHQSRLLQPGWAKHSPPRKQHSTSPTTGSSHEWLGGRVSHQGEEYSVCSEQESAASLRGLSLEDLINVSGVYVHSKAEARGSHQGNTHHQSRTVSFDLDSSLEDLREGTYVMISRLLYHLYTRVSTDRLYFCVCRLHALSLPECQ